MLLCIIHEKKKLIKIFVDYLFISTFALIHYCDIKLSYPFGGVVEKILYHTLYFNIYIIFSSVSILKKLYILWMISTRRLRFNQEYLVSLNAS